VPVRFRKAPLEVAPPAVRGLGGRAVRKRKREEAIAEVHCSRSGMLRRILSLSLILVLAASTQAATRWLTEREGAPVRWQAWGAAAMARAKKENRPIFLAIGYASSFQCYRMHREAFLSGEIAEHLNAYFIPVVLDPIEHPEIAEAYETVLRDGCRAGVPLDSHPHAGARADRGCRLSPAG
jgi:hypothetical protein